MKYTVDRIENEYAILEDNNQKMINVPISDININIKSGDVLTYDITNNKYSIDLNEKDEKMNRIKAKLDKLKHIS